MKPLIEIRQVDRTFYQERIRYFLPERIIDVHAHVWRVQDYPQEPPGRDSRTATWPDRVAKENPIEDLLETYRLLLPDKQVTPLIFPTLPRGSNLEAINRYVAEVARARGLPALLFTDPAWSAQEMERRMVEGSYLGAKSYLSLAPPCLPADEIRIYDFFPPHQLAVHDRRGSIIMLHIPRDGRLKDPVNLAQMLEIERRYPAVHLIIAHVGRAYCDHDVGDAFQVLAESRRMCFDISANTNDWVFEQLIRCVGPGRVLYGTDLPVERMRMRRITVGDHYVNLVPKGLYGDVSGDRNMAELEGEEAERLTFFLYEQVDAFRRAAERCGLRRGDIKDVFHNNAARILQDARKSLA